jgi:DMSO/TMAO reductase YedYZ heme-binding membrane subunit
MIHTLLYIFIVLCIVGLILWGISMIPGIPPIVKTVIYVIIGVVLLLWCLQYVGGVGGPGIDLRR